jgi:hypothetical protein
VDTAESDPEEGLHDAAEISEAETDDGEGDSQPVTLSELAGHLELDVKDMYDVQIPMKGGDPVTLGELKDNYQEFGPVAEQRKQVEASKDQYERDVLATRRQIDAMRSVAQTPQQQAMLKQMMDAASTYQEGWAKDQEKLVLEAVPEWKDADERAKDRDAIFALGREYGFSEAEMQYTQDARTLKMLKRHVLLEARLESIDSASKIKRTAPGAPGKQNTKKVTQRKLQDRVRQAKSSPRIEDKRSVVQHFHNQGK